jgi:hypothetical protein
MNRTEEAKLTSNQSTDHEGRAEEIEEHKQDLLKKKQEGKQHWKDELASNSESIVRLLLHLTPSRRLIQRSQTSLASAT